MSTAARTLVVLGTVLVLVIAFVVLSPAEDDDGSTAARTQTTPQPAATTTAPAAQPQAKPQPTYTTVRVRAGKPVGGMKKITLSKGERARIEVSSPDTSDEIHLHGYDLSRDLKAGGRVRFAFKAQLEGIFEIELEHAGVQIAELTVQPR